MGYASARVHEEGGNNRGDQVEFFQRLMGGAPGDPWCADFVCTCLVKGYARSRVLPEDRVTLLNLAGSAGRQVPLSGYCPSIASIARSRGQFRPPVFAPVPGDLVLFDFTSRGEAHHVGFVMGNRPGGLLATIEGNTSSGVAGSQSDGDGVYIRNRPRSPVYGYVHFG